MARGLANGEHVVSQASTDAYRESHTRALGEFKPGSRGRWVYDEAQRRLVRAEDYVPPARAVDAPIMTGRCHEGQIAPDGTDIGTRAKRAAWSRATGCADYDDFKGARARRAKADAEKRQMLETGRPARPDPGLRDFIGRELYKRKMIL
jgi:hypothetical protein